jgi:hypothetical protein
MALPAQLGYASVLRSSVTRATQVPRHSLPASFIASFGSQRNFSVTMSRGCESKLSSYKKTAVIDKIDTVQKIQVKNPVVGAFV